MVSIYPCGIHGRRTSTRLGSAYITVARGTSKRSRKLRVCSPCLADIFATVGQNWVSLGDDDEVSVAEVCGACEAPLPVEEERYGCFVTTYERGDDRRDYFAWYCPVDADSLAETLGLNRV